MSDSIIVALITGAVSLLGILLTTRATQNKMSHDLDKAVALLQADNKRMGEDIKEHNHYAKMFAETMPVVQEQIKNIDKRLSDLEKG